MNRPLMNRFHVQVPDQRWFEENIGCENACPVNTRAPQYISAIREENYNLDFELSSKYFLVMAKERFETAFIVRSEPITLTLLIDTADLENCFERSESAIVRSGNVFNIV